ncbi:hypothetical protein UPYG_G00068080 [Umbra pygmaea]|uniref:Uncharacterized protein n=1 Tax=Umbra pygmaea TaxID=75934 RepID=A0ABD0XAX5_UMBPY
MEEDMQEVNEGHGQWRMRAWYIKGYDLRSALWLCYRWFAQCLLFCCCDVTVMVKRRSKTCCVCNDS